MGSHVKQQAHLGNSFRSRFRRFGQSRHHSNQTPRAKQKRAQTPKRRQVTLLDLTPLLFLMAVPSMSTTRLMDMKDMLLMLPMMALLSTQISQLSMLPLLPILDKMDKGCGLTRHNTKR